MFAFRICMGMMSIFTPVSGLIFFIFCLVIAIQLFYYLYFFKKLAFYKDEERAQTQTHPVSVIICAKDEAANLAKFLPGVLVQKFPTTHEVVVVNDNSTDESKYILEEYQKTFKHLQILTLKQKAMLIPGKKYPLSMGIRAAQHEVLLLTDADCVPATEFWIQKMQNRFHNGIEIVLGYSPFRKKEGVLNKLIRWEGFMTAVQYFSFALRGKTYMGVGRNLCYKKSLFLDNKGFSAFNHTLSGDDDLFINNVATENNVAVSLDPDTFILSDPPGTWEAWKKQKFRHYTTSKYYKPEHKVLLGGFSLSSLLLFPAFLAGVVFFNWKIVLAIYVLFAAVRHFILDRCAQKLQAKDLIVWTIIFDIWMFIYYLVFAGALIRKPDKEWK